MKKTSFKKKLQYWFDNWMARGTISMVALLFLATAVVVIVTGVLSAFASGSDASVMSSIWGSLMHAIDAGTLTADTGNFWFMLLMSVVTLCGLLITSVLIGIINAGMESKMEDLRKGKSDVLEKDHTIIIGFNDGVFTLLNELIEANSNQKRAAVVIIDGRHDKEEMEDMIHRRIPDKKTTKIICRSGNIASFTDLAVCSPDTCRSVIINTDDDFVTIKAILAVTNLLKASGNADAYLTAVIRDEQNLTAARIAGEDRAEILYFRDTISRIIAHTMHQSGLSLIYTELFDYGGDEFYIEAIPQMAGKRMSEANLYFPVSTVVGIQRGERTLLNPPADTLIEKADRLILLAADDNVSIPAEQAAAYDASVFANGNVSDDQPQRFLILGYDSKLALILAEENQCMAEGSEIILGIPEEYASEVGEIADMTFDRISVRTSLCDIYDIEELKKLLAVNPAAVLVLSNQEMDSEEADARTLLLLLQIRRYAKETGVKFSVTSEMQNIENQELAKVTEVNDFVISSNITNLMVTQISQSRELRAVFGELLTMEGSEIYMKPACNYVRAGAETDLYTVGMAAALRTEVCIGYRKRTEDGKYAIVTNPPKNTRVCFNAGDSLIVIAED